ncbi:CopD family protein, partial [Enterobacter hormaechei]|uniref:CopD family protein n=1 Tax=Enterobacter hormaechei TaxID=158836 RepID=UPI0020425891
LGGSIQTLTGAAHGRWLLLKLALVGGMLGLAALHRWRLVPALPINAQGKVTQAALAALFQPLMPVPVWDHRDAASATLRMTLDPALRPFQGHFPQAAILPG